MMRLSDYPGSASASAAQQPQSPPPPPRDTCKISELAAWVPLRLSPAERHLLAVLEQTLNVSEYTDHVDVASRRSGTLKTRRILEGVLEVCHIATGLASASGQERQVTQSLSLESSSSSSSHLLHGTSKNSNHDYNNNNNNHNHNEQGVIVGAAKNADCRGKIKKGKKQKLTKRLKKKAAVAAEEARRMFSSSNSNSAAAATTNINDSDQNAEDAPTLNNTPNTNIHHNPYVPWAARDPEENAALFQTMCEIGRRNKVLNPNSMRTTYGKLMYLLQDAQNPTVAKSLGFSLHKDLVLVKPYLEQHGLVDLLYDSRLECAVQYIHDRDSITGQRLERLHVEALVQGKRRVTQELVDAYGNDDDDDDDSSTTITTTQDNNNTDADHDVHHQNDHAAAAKAGNASGMDSENNNHQNHETTSHKSPTAAKSKANGGGRRRGPGLSRQDVCRVIESLADAVAYIESNVRPVQQMLQYLQDNFDPYHEERDFSLTLRGSSRGSYNGGGGGGSSLNSPSLYSRYGLSAYGGNTGSSSEGPTLSHSHSTQYTFVWQSLTLWSKVMRHMHRLWVCADDDLLSTTSTYHLYNTGQGLNRVQQCPKVRRVMGQLLQQTQAETTGGNNNGNNINNSWVGLSVIHLGDRDVPNALIFIDKYTQIPRFLNPIVHFLQNLPELCQNETILAYVKEQFGSEQRLQRTVLADYFKHGFDGSGDDGGSCIDGRLTSSWNWTSRLAKKSYYHAFMLSGFQGFDGDFR